MGFLQMLFIKLADLTVFIVKAFFVLIFFVVVLMVVLSGRDAGRDARDGTAHSEAHPAGFEVSKETPGADGGSDPTHQMTERAARDTAVPGIAASKPTGIPTPLAPHSMGTIYFAIGIVNARATGGPYRSGDIVEVAYDLVNQTDFELRIPENRSYSRPLFLVGTRQHWVERKGGDSSIPAIPPNIGRRGTRYAAGGSIIPVNPTLAAGESLPFREQIVTRGYPSGRYTYYIQYEQLDGSVLQETAVDFELRDPDRILERRQ